jgi:DNA repair protein RadC
VRLPIYKLKLVRCGWMGDPPIDLEQPQLVAHYFHRLIGQAAVEHAAVIFVDPVGQLTGSTIVSIGDLARVQMLAREVFKAAILANASGVILGHNHPAPSSSEPSPQDLRATKGLIGAGSILGIDVLDHIIVTTSDKDFTSMRERGLLSIFWGALGGLPKLASPRGSRQGERS